MYSLQKLKAGDKLYGIVPEQVVSVINIKYHGAGAATVYYEQSDGTLGTRLLYTSDEPSLQLADLTVHWAFTAQGTKFQMAAEAYRIHLAHLFDPFLAVHTSLIEPFPHQITAVYGEMLKHQPLRYLLADDPGAGKTIMAGLLIRELVARGDVNRCLICAPGSLTQQWQDELHDKFQLEFRQFSREVAENTRSKNPFNDNDFLIVRLDQLSRNEALQEKLQVTEWDLIVCDEAHKMSASFSGRDLKETKRYKLGKLFGQITRHLLLLTATPHNGKEEDFQLFLALLDPDRFERGFKQGVQKANASDMMRRMVKEKLLRFDGKPLFPERKAYTVSYQLSDEEAELYEAVTQYVRTEFNRAEQLGSEGRKGTVGFALTILQRRLASSPEAIYRSIKRRRERLESRLREARQAQGQRLRINVTEVDEEAWEELDDAPEEEIFQIETEVIDNATAAQTITELEEEIYTLKTLETTALRVRQKDVDRKWAELQSMLQENPEMSLLRSGQHKLVIFTEHRDTLTYLYQRLVTLVGRRDAVVYIHGGLDRDKRREAEERFRNDPKVLILVATDAAGEGINLQRAHLMVNYDLPWNPNRLEQRFGRIHRIGQTEVCHLWNLVADQTREGHVYLRLLSKLQTERNALNGQVFDVLGKLFEETPLRKLLVEAIRYGDKPEVRAQLEKAVDNALDRHRLEELLASQALVTNVLNTVQVTQIREEMERAAARRLQPHFIKSFFLQAFSALGGKSVDFLNGRYRLLHVPQEIREWARDHGMHPISERYEAICFEKHMLNMPGKAAAAFVCPGHALLDATIGLVLHRWGEVLTKGTRLIDDRDLSQTPRILFHIEQAIEDDLQRADGKSNIVSREVHFIEIDWDGGIREGGGAPYLDYRIATSEEYARIKDITVPSDRNYPNEVIGYAVQCLVPRHVENITKQRVAFIEKTERAVKERLSREANYWRTEARKYSDQERLGKPNAGLNRRNALDRAERLQKRLKIRLEQLQKERQLHPKPPVIIAGALIIPIGMLLGDQVRQNLLARRVTEQIAMQAVIDAEIKLGNSPKDVSKQNLGYDVESIEMRTGSLRFIEVKGRHEAADTITITKNEILTALNTQDKYILAIVLVRGAEAVNVRYLRDPFRTAPDIEAQSVNYNIDDLLARAERPN